MVKISENQKYRIEGLKKSMSLTLLENKLVVENNLGYNDLVANIFDLEL